MAGCPVLVRRPPPDPPGVLESLKVGLRRRCEWGPQGARLWALLPVTLWLPRYRPREDLAGDVLSGLVIGVILVPQAIAYAQLAGLQPLSGLHTAFFAGLVYFLLGTSRHVSVGIFSLLSLMVGQVVDRELQLAGFDLSLDGSSQAPNRSALNTSAATLVPAGCDRDCYAVRVASALTLGCGLYQVLMGVLGLGRVLAWLSQPLLDGFAVGASLTILTSQLRHLLGVGLPRLRGPGVVPRTWLSLLRALPRANLCDVLTSALSLAALLAAGALNRRCRSLQAPFPAELLVMVAATLASRLGRFHQRFGAAVAGDIPTGLPPPEAPDPRLLWRLVPDAAPLALVGATFSVSLAEMFARAHGYSTRADQELLAVGCGNVLPAFFGCFATSAMLAKTLVRDAAGGRSQLSGVVSAAVVLLALLALAPLFRDLPRSVLACVVAAGLRGALRKVAELPRLWCLSRADALVWVATAATCVLLSTEAGLLAGLLLSLLGLAGRSRCPPAALLARAPASDFYGDPAEFEGLLPEPGVHVFRFSGPLHFANKDGFLRALYSLTGLDAGRAAGGQRAGGGVALLPAEPGFHAVIVDCAPLLFLDSAGLAVLRDLRRDYKALGVSLLLAGCSPSVRSALQRAGVLGEPPDSAEEDATFFHSVHSAVCSARARRLGPMPTDSTV